MGKIFLSYWTDCSITQDLVIGGVDFYSTVKSGGRE